MPRRLLTLTLPLLAACQSPTCPAVPPGPSVIIYVKEAGTGIIPDQSPPGIVITAGYSDSLKPTFFDGEGHWTALGAGNRAGTYSARIEAPGYQLWQRSGLHAEEAACGVIAAVTTAELVRD